MAAKTAWFVVRPVTPDLWMIAEPGHDSGQTNGKRCIRCGRANLRQALCKPAVVAIRFNDDMKARYQSLVAAGKPAKVAIVAVMRNLAVLANALLKAGRNLAPKTA